jgi:hypothetical protein
MLSLCKVRRANKVDYLFNFYLFLGEHDSLNRIVVVFVDHLKLGVVFASLEYQKRFLFKNIYLACN